jgi:hypothetical protein
VDIEVTDQLPEPQAGDIPPIQEALKTAAKNRPEIEQANLNLRNQEYIVKARRNALLPTLNVFASYFPSGLSGNTPIYGACPAGSSPSGGACYPLAGQPFARPVAATNSNGVWQALTQTFHGNYPITPLA